jgi:hypothetical protein
MACRQLEYLPNTIRPLLGVVNAVSAVSARTLTCRTPAVPRSCSMLSVYTAVRRARSPNCRSKNWVRPLDPDVARVEREGIAAFDAVPLEGLVPPFPPPQAGEG